MCQLLGMNCNVPTDVTFSFTGFAQRGGKTDHHSDGWGIAFFEDKGLRHFVDHQAAVESPVAELIRRYPIKSKNVIAHIRKATQGVVSLQNCHPFVRELWGATGSSPTTETSRTFALACIRISAPWETPTANMLSAGSCRNWRNLTPAYHPSQS